MNEAIDPARRRLGPVNWIGLWTLYRREVRRFLKVAAQTVFGPLVTTLLFLAVFGVAIGRRAPIAAGVPFLEFLAPGLIMMTVAQNAFANSSSSLLILKMQGNISDFLTAPLRPGELTLGMALGGLTRGLVVGAALALALWFFVPIRVVDFAFVSFHAVAGSLLLALLGIVAGLWAQKMDHLAAVTNFVVAPLTFLSGTFYSILDLPDPFRRAALADPFFYMIDGFRYGLTGHADGSLIVGIVVMIAANLLLVVICHQVIAKGWRLKP